MGSYLDGFHSSSHSKLLLSNHRTQETAHTPTAVWEQRGVGSIPAKRTERKEKKKREKRDEKNK